MSFFVFIPLRMPNQVDRNPISIVKPCPLEKVQHEAFSVSIHSISMEGENVQGTNQLENDTKAEAADHVNDSHDGAYEAALANALIIPNVSQNTCNTTTIQNTPTIPSSIPVE